MTEPTRRERLRPAELIGLAAVLAVVTGVIAYFGTRDLLLSGVFTAIAFIVSLVLFAMMLLAVTPKRDESDDDRPAGGH